MKTRNYSNWENGTRFEIWLEMLLNLMNRLPGSVQRYNIIRDSEYFRQNGSSRQVDISYDMVYNGNIARVVVEAKYSSGDVLSSSSKKKKVQDDSIENVIDDIIDETIDRQRFVQADLAILATNSYIHSSLRKKAALYSLGVVDKNILVMIYSSLGYQGDIDKSISSIDLSKYRTKRNIFYI